MTLLMPQDATGSSTEAIAEGAKGENKQVCNTKNEDALSKVVIQRLPPTLIKEQLWELLQPEHDYFEFFFPIHMRSVLICMLGHISTLKTKKALFYSGTDLMTLYSLTIKVRNIMLQ